MIVAISMKDRQFNSVGESEGFRNPEPLRISGISVEGIKFLRECFIWKRILLWRIGDESEFHAWISDICLIDSKRTATLKLEVEQL